MSDKATEYTVENTENEADWAFRWGQEARTRQELDKRLAAIIFDAGVFIELFGQMLEKAGTDDESWIELVPNLLDMRHDLQIHLRNFLSRPVGMLAEDEELMRLIKLVQHDQETEHDIHRIDEMVQDYTKRANKQVMKDFDDWSKENCDQSYKDRRAQHRSEWMLKIPQLFAKLIAMKTPGNSDTFEREVRKIKKLMESKASAKS